MKLKVSLKACLFWCSMLVARSTVPFPSIVSEMTLPFSFFLQNKHGENSVLNNIEGKDHMVNHVDV